MQCPGQDSRYWDGDAVFETQCPQCDHAVEFFKDDTSRKCGNCGLRVPNPRLDFGCAAHCPYAEQCLGALPAELLTKKKELLKDRVAVAMKRYFGADFKRIGHAGRVARYAEEIGKTEENNPAVVLIAAYLHDIGIKEAERKHGSTLPRYQHMEGPPVAAAILNRLGAGSELIAEVCDIVGHHHHPRPEESANFKVVYDADLIVQFEEQQKENPATRERLERKIARSFLTESGARLAAKVLIKGNS